MPFFNPSGKYCRSKDPATGLYCGVDPKSGDFCVTCTNKKVFGTCSNKKKDGSSCSGVLEEVLVNCWSCKEVTIFGEKYLTANGISLKQVCECSHPIGKFGGKFCGMCGVKTPWSDTIQDVEDYLQTTKQGCFEVSKV